MNLKRKHVECQYKKTQGGVTQHENIFDGGLYFILRCFMIYNTGPKCQIAQNAKFYMDIEVCQRNILSLEIKMYFIEKQFD